MAQTDRPSESGTVIKATLARYNEGEDECTLHPMYPSESKRTTEWITAKQGSYVSLALCR